MNRRPHRRAAPILLSFAAVLAAGCYSSQPTAPASQPTLTTGLNALERPEKSAAAPAQSPEELLRKLEEAQARAPARPAPPVIDTSAGGVRANPTASIDASPDSAPASEKTEATTPADPAPPAAPALTPQQNKQRLVAELAAVLRDEGANSGAPAAVEARAAALELVLPGAGSHGPQSPVPAAPLSPREAETLEAWREMFEQARSALDSTGDVGRLVDPVSAAAERLRRSQPLRIADSRLCTKVSGFGLYDELKKYGPGYKLLAGRRHRLVVYVELADFAPAPATLEGVAGHEVSLVQDLSLFHAGGEGDLLAWRRPDQAIRDFSRNRRRDFFIVQLIELPETLTVGSYRLKITVADKGGESSAQSIVPIDMVGDASALRAER